MPEKVEDKGEGTPKEKPEVVQDTLAQALDSTKRTFDGKPVSEEGPALGGHPAEEEPAPKPEEGPGSEEVVTPEPETFKYKGQAEAESAALEGQRHTTKLSMELQETRDLLLKALAGQKSEELPIKPEVLVEDPAKFVKQRRIEVLDEIEKLDPDDEAYKEKVADAQAKADADILKHHQDIQNADRKAEDERLAEKKNREDRQRDDTQAVIDQAGTAMKDAGLDALPESEDSILFWALTQVAPREKDGVPLSVDEQIQWTINKTKTYKTQALETYKTEKARELAEQRQEEGQPLDRGVTGPVVTKTATDSAKQAVTLGSVLDAVTESRRI